MQPCMLACMGELTLNQARTLCANWAAEVRQRDWIVREAVLAGLPKSEVAELMGITRSTVYRALDAVLPQVSMVREHIVDHNEHNDMGAT